MPLIKLKRRSLPASAPSSATPIDPADTTSVSPLVRARPRMNRSDAAKYLRECGYPISANQLAKFAVTGGGPEYHRWGKRVLYEPVALLQWARERETIAGRRGA